MKALIKQILWGLDAGNTETELEIFHPEWGGSEKLTGILAFNCFEVATFYLQSEDKEIRFNAAEILEVKINQEKVCVKISVDGIE